MSKAIDYIVVILLVVFCFLPFFSDNKTLMFILLELSLVGISVLTLLFLSLVQRFKQLEDRYIKLYKAFSGESVKL